MNEQVEHRILATKLTPGAKRCRVLIVGRDHKLLQSRAWVMEDGTFEVLITTDLEEAQTTIARGALDGLLLCHSLPEVEAKSIVRQMGVDRPDMPVLLLTSLAPTFSIAVEAFDVSRGPRALLVKCTQLFAPREPPMKGGRP
jgi:hypothetical protein